MRLREPRQGAHAGLLLICFRMEPFLSSCTVVSFLPGLKRVTPDDHAEAAKLLQSKCEDAC